MISRLIDHDAVTHPADLVNAVRGPLGGSALAFCGYTAVEEGGAADDRDFDPDDCAIFDRLDNLCLQISIALIRARFRRCAALLIDRGGDSGLRLGIASQGTLRSVAEGQRFERRCGRRFKGSAGPVRFGWRSKHSGRR